ncbi:exported hypothetical protein [Gammaproteobacteria bacterium]
MNRFVRSKLVTAVAFALSAGVGISTQVSAAAVDATTGGWLSEDLGDVLLFPYYTVRDDANGHPFKTSFTITNTDALNTIWVKFRLRDSVDSQDVLDFQIMLSPLDEIVAWMDRDSASGQPRVNFNSDETSCRIPWKGGATTFTAPGGTVSVQNAQEGHLEVIPIAALPIAAPGGTLNGKLAVHTPGNPTTHAQNCANLSNIIERGVQATFVTGLGALTIASGGTPVPNVLRGAYSITSSESGFSGGGNAITIANWDNAAPVGSLAFGQNSNTVTRGAVAANQVTQLNGADTHQWDHPHLGDLAITRNIDRGLPVTAGVTLAATSGLGFNGQMNNWSTNPANGVGIDWVITYFTKYLYRDANGFYGQSSPYNWPAPSYAVATQQKAAVAGDRTVMPYDPSNNAVTGAGISPWTKAVGIASGNNGGRCIEASISILDREEGFGGGGVSPGVGTVLCKESNVIAFRTSQDPRPVLRTTPDAVIDATTTNAGMNYGWAKVNVNPSDVGPANPPGLGVAVGGFSYTLRDLGDPTLAFSAITPNSNMDRP